MQEYISLHNHTMFSIMSSMIKPTALIERAAEMEMKAIAVTDSYTLGGIHDCYKAAKAKKIKLIVGCQFFFVEDTKPIDDFNSGETKEKPKLIPRTVILLAKNQLGYKNLLLLNK